MLDEIPKNAQSPDDPPPKGRLGDSSKRVKPQNTPPGKDGVNAGGLLRRWGRKLLGGTARALLNIVGGLLAGATIAAVLLFWRLSEGPISLAYLAPYISTAINNTVPGLKASFRDTVLVWAGWQRAIDVRILDLRFNADNGETVGFVPETSFSLSTSALLHGKFAASALELFKPTLSIRREANGHLEFGFASKGAGDSAVDVDTRRILTWLTHDGDNGHSVAFLNQLTITDADVIVEDRVAGRSWVAPGAHVRVSRIDDGLSLSATFYANLDSNEKSQFLLSGKVNGETGKINASLTFDRVNPISLSTINDAAMELSRVNMPFDGTIRLLGNIDGQIEQVGFDLSSREGRVLLPPPLDQSLATKSVRIVGNFDAVIHRLDIHKLDVAFADGTVLRMPASVNHTYPISSFSFLGDYQGGENRLTVKRLTAHVGDLDVNASGVVDDVLGKPAIDLKVHIPEIPVEDINRYWPASFGEDAYTWVMPHVVGGKISDFNVSIAGGVGQGSKFAVDQLNGDFRFNDVVMSYLDTMPNITNAHGAAHFDRDKLIFDIEQAQSYGMPIGKADVTLSGISGDNEHASIHAAVSGSFKQAMELIDREPLGYAKDLGIDPATVTGKAKVDLGFDFPLLTDLQWKDVKVKAHAVVNGLNAPSGLFGLDIADGGVEIDVNNDGMDIIGDMRLKGYATNINWHQSFDPKSSVSNTYTLNVWVDRVESLADLGIKTGPFAGNLIKGDMPLWLNVVENRNGQSTLSARADLTGVRLHLKPLEWSKPSGTAGEAYAEVKLKDGKISDITSFRMKAPDLFIEGSADYDGKTQALSRVELKKVNVGRTNLSGLLIPRDNGVWDADFSGKSLDLAGVWDEMFNGNQLESGSDLLPELTVSAQFGRVWLSKTQHVDGLTSAFVRENDMWRTIFVTTTLEGKDTIGIKLAPSLDGKPSRVLTMWSKDAGAVMRLFRVSDNMVGGNFNLRGTFDDSKPNSPLTGNLQVENFRIRNAPTMTKVLSLMSLTGILESLGGEGLYFSNLDLPFSYDDGVIEMTSARANGPSLGFTASGKVYTHADVVDIQGTVVPAYMLNSLLGNIPLVGGLFTGGEAGGGVFAARYTMTGSREDPDVSVNALSALTPGFLRNLFGLFDDRNSGDAIGSSEGSLRKPILPPD